MILIVASAGDLAAEALAAGWIESNARLVRPADLSTPGWRHYVGVAGGPGVVAVGGEVVPETEITGVLTRLPWVNPAELVHILPDDRDYIAAEISAFLLSWLTSIDRPVLNRPMPGCLCGPPWRATQWMAAARVAGLRVAPRGGFHQGSSPASVTVVGEQCFGEVAPELNEGSMRLSKLAGTDLLDVTFDGNAADAAFLGANVCPSLENTGERAAALALLHGPVRRTEGFPDLRPWRHAHA
jgi:hypothetical protein